MALSPGVRLGPYEILCAIGAGGMGEVYRARDSRLVRDVALKVLPEAFARDPDRMVRFEREAKVLASNHPNIASLYGLEESNGARALVMELVEGPTLSERIKQGSLPIAEALPLAKQIAEGLEHAHERGIIHRDLKPSNVKLTPDGQVKILDFGLAKALEGESTEEELRNSPTLSAATTRAGVLLGTAAYMSPEQARCNRVDRRTDIWAFGCVLYEMLSGLPAFGGETTSDILACVIRAEPDWSSLPASVPPRLRELLRRCFQKDPKQRLQAIGEARVTIEELLAGAPDVTTLPATPVDARLRLRERIAWSAAVALLTIVAALLAIGYFSRTPKPARPIISQIGPPENTKFVLAGLSAGPPVLSPDGNSLAFAARSADGKQLLWVRSLDGATERALAGTEGATFPFWSSDSRSLAFFANGKLNRIDATGGPLLDLCDAVSGRGGSWGADGTILFALLSGPILRVPASGGTPQPVTKLTGPLNQFSHRWPQFLPDGRHFLFLGQATSSGDSAIYVGSLDGVDPKLLLRNESNAVYAPPGYLLFLRQETLLAQPFDTNKLQLAGEAAPLAGHGGVDSNMAKANFSVSENGILVYANGTMSEARLLWFDRSGKQLAETAGVDLYGFPRISPDGRKLAVSKLSAASSSGIWIFDLNRNTSSRLTFFAGKDAMPVWSPDGKFIAFASSQAANRHIYQQAADGTGTATPLVNAQADEILPSWSSDGRYLIFQSHSNQGNSPWEIWAAQLFGDRKIFPLAQNPHFLQGDAALSPDGKWFAHDTDETGRLEVYLAPFLHGGGKWQLSTSGGGCARWRADGRELFYMSLDNKLMSVEISEQGSSVVIGKVQPLFQANPVPRAPECMYDVTPDGQKFVVVTLALEPGSQPETLVVNWPALLKKERQQ